MTTAIAVAAVLTFSFALGSLMIRQVDGATLRRWRLSRRWDVSRLAREFVKAADEPLATLRGLRHMINAWERGARRPSERYWLLYLRVFPECATSEPVNDSPANGDPVNGGPKEARALPGAAKIDAVEPATVNSAHSADPGDIRTLTATVRALEQQIARLSRRLDDLTRDDHGDEQPGERSTRRKTASGQWRWTWTAS